MLRAFFCLCIVVFVVAPQAARAHPVPRSNHDRTVVVRIERDPHDGALVLNVAYRLEVDEYTVILEDMAPFNDEAPFNKFKAHLRPHSRQNAAGVR